MELSICDEVFECGRKRKPAFKTKENQKKPKDIAKVLKLVVCFLLRRWILGGGVGVHCTVNPLYDGLTSADEASKAAWIFISETLTIRPLGLAVYGQLP